MDSFRLVADMLLVAFLGVTMLRVGFFGLLLRYFIVGGLAREECRDLQG